MNGVHSTDVGKERAIKALSVAGVGGWHTRHQNSVHGGWARIGEGLQASLG
jgi:hypothetical protein